MYRTYRVQEDCSADSENPVCRRWRRPLGRANGTLSVEPDEIVRSAGVPGARSKLVGMAYEIPVTQARAELADLINRVVYGGERVVVTRHGKPLVALVSAADLERLEELPESAEEQVVSSLSSVREVASAPRERQRFGIAAEHRGHGAS
jgi:prevent-host-death family protein